MVGQGTIDLIRGGDCGYAVASGNYEALTNVIANVVLTNVDEFKKKVLMVEECMRMNLR